VEGLPLPPAHYFPAGDALDNDDDDMAYGGPPNNANDNNAIDNEPHSDSDESDEEESDNENSEDESESDDDDPDQTPAANQADIGADVVDGMGNDAQHQGL
jgi:hypothetical protein